MVKGWKKPLDAKSISVGPFDNLKPNDGHKAVRIKGWETESQRKKLLLGCPFMGRQHPNLKKMSSEMSKKLEVKTRPVTTQSWCVWIKSFPSCCRCAADGSKSLMPEFNNCAETVLESMRYNTAKPKKKSPGSTMSTLLWRRTTSYQRSTFEGGLTLSNKYM